MWASMAVAMAVVMAVAMASAVLAFFDEGVAVDVCFDVVGCVRLLLCSRVPAFVVVVEDVVDVPPILHWQLQP